jgi:hypothetical protein
VLRCLLRDEPLPTDSARAVEAHVAGCADCQRALEGLIGSAPDVLGILPEVPAGLSDDAPPVLPGYEPVGRLDAGGMGVVWRVRDLEFQRTLAAKVMKARATIRTCAGGSWPRPESRAGSRTRPSSRSTRGASSRTGAPTSR